MFEKTTEEQYIQLLNDLTKKNNELQLENNDLNFYKTTYSSLCTKAFGQESLIDIVMIETSFAPVDNKVKLIATCSMSKDEYSKFVDSNSELFYLRYKPDIEEVKKQCQ